MGNWVRKVKELRSTDLYFQNSVEEVKYSIGHIINNIVVSMYGASWVLEISRGTLYKVYDCLTTTLYT